MNTNDKMQSMPKKVIKFAQSCVENMTPQELTDNLELANNSCASDCDVWTISPKQWRFAIQTAHYVKTIDGSIMDDGRVVV